MLAEGLTEADDEILILADGLSEILEEGLWLGLIELDGESDELLDGLTEALGETLAE